jgi:hypothetical protein
MGHERVLQKLRNRRSTKPGSSALPRNGGEMNPGACRTIAGSLNFFNAGRLTAFRGGKAIRVGSGLIHDTTPLHLAGARSGPSVVGTLFSVLIGDDSAMRQTLNGCIMEPFIFMKGIGAKGSNPQASSSSTVASCGAAVRLRKAVPG